MMKYRAIITIYCIFIIGSSQLMQVDAAALERDSSVKARYVLNFPLFMDWLGNSCAGTTHFVIAVIGNVPYETDLKGMEGKIIKGKPLKVVRIEEMDELQCCHMLIIGSSERYRLTSILAKAHDRGILTISDMRFFSQEGGCINLINTGNRIVYNININAIRKAELQPSASILSLARDILR